jgi:hypothetical protein
LTTKTITLVDLPAERIKRSAGCWAWDGRRNDNGYATYGPRLVHRMMKENSLGRLLSRREALDHLCENRWCINPDHLDICSNAENGRRGAEMKRWRNQIRRFLDTGRWETNAAAKNRRWKGTGA